MKDRADILLIEDEPNIAEAVRFILMRDGWQVLVISDGAAAMAAIRNRRPRLIILDLMLPHRSGRDILADLRKDADPVLASTRVLLLTAQGQAAAVAQTSGADAAMAKPFANDALRDRVRQLLTASA